jgi:hypothetical protein
LRGLVWLGRHGGAVMAQLPIYTLPVIQRRLYHRWLSAAPPAP